MGMNLNSSTTAPAVKENLVAATYDLAAESQKSVATAEEIDRMLSTIDINNIDTVQAFGNEAAMEMGKAADVAMQDMSRAMLFEENTSTLMKDLRRIMESVDVREINRKPGLFENIKKKIEKLLARYQSIGVDIDKIYVELKKYEEEAKQANRKLDQLFIGNVKTFKDLQKFIEAGDHGIEQMREALDAKTQEFQNSQDPTVKFEIDKINNALSIFERKVASLRTAENYAMQNIPMIQMQQMTNMNLIAKIDEDFIVTLPVFKNGIVNAVMLKRQKLQADSLAELDKKTNEMIRRNAQTTVEVAKSSAALAAKSSIDVAALEESWRTITNGIDEVARIQEDAHKKREEDKQRLAQIKADFYSKFGAPTSN